MSFPGISRVLNGFKERVRTQTFFGHPKKKTKAENPTQNKTKKKGGGGNWGEKTVSVIFQRSRLGGRGREEKSAVGKDGEKLAGRGRLSCSSSPRRGRGQPQPLPGHRSRSPGLAPLLAPTEAGRVGWLVLGER